MARRESWRGKSSERGTGPTIEAAGLRKEQAREGNRPTRDGQRDPYSDIGSGMAKW